jgi:hypothetical protein
MTRGRRTLGYKSFEEVLPDVDRLLQGHTTVGEWTLAQICRRLAIHLAHHLSFALPTAAD